MASDETASTTHLSMPEDESDDGYDHQHPSSHHHLLPPGPNLSRLSVCSSSFTCGNDEDEDEDEDDGNNKDNFYGNMGMYMSRLSIESFDADEEFSPASDSDKDVPECYSLPATPPRRRRSRTATEVLKDYASENEARKSSARPRKNARRRVVRERLGDGRKKEEEWSGNTGNGWNGVSNNSGESEGCGVVVITRPKGGRRSLCMDLEEVKACRDLGFELEHERMLEVPPRMSASGSNFDTASSGGNSPIANWRISSPGDDPRDVKARLKVWAQAVALVSASQTQSN